MAADNPKLTAGETRLSNTFGWFARQSLARYTLRNGEAVRPRGASREGSELKAYVDIERIPRTIPSPTDANTQIANPAAFTSDTFEDHVYSAGDRVFSNSGDEFKVSGYVGSDHGTSTARDAQNIVSGLKLTNDGIVIRTGGTGLWGDFADMRRDITRSVSPGTPNGQNGWDLVLTFGEPRTISTPIGAPDRNLRSDWTGNGNFYWRSLVPADPSQLETDGDYYASNAFGQEEGFRDLGTYEVWLSNYIGVDTKLEPLAGTTATCPDGSTRSSCPDDDEPYYLKYAAYGLFVFAADRQTYLGGQANGHLGRLNSMYFGYSAFEDEDGKKAEDISTAITSAKFHGHTLAYAGTGVTQNPANRASKLLRGDATLTVTMSATTRTIEGNLENFEEWTGERWRAFTSGFSVDLRSANIGAAGTFTGTAAHLNGGRSEDFPYAPGLSTGGGVSSPGLFYVGRYTGSFYGPRDDSDDLEVAGSYTFRALNSSQWQIYGSFGAKQRPVATPASN